MADKLKKYRGKRNLAVTTEPAAGGKANEGARSFVVQKHWARHLHYDFCLELDGLMKSWAVPKGPSYDPAINAWPCRLRITPLPITSLKGKFRRANMAQVRSSFGTRGWTPIGDPRKGYRAGHLTFDLHGVKMQSRYTLVRLKGQEPKNSLLGF